MFLDLHNLNHKVYFFFFNFIQYVFSLLFYVSKRQFVSRQPISVTDIGWRVKHVKRLMSLCLQNLWFRFTLFWNFTQSRLDCLTLEGGTDRLYRNVGNKLRCVTSQKSADLLHRAKPIFFNCRFEGGGCCSPFGCAPYWSSLQKYLKKYCYTWLLVWTVAQHFEGGYCVFNSDELPSHNNTPLFMFADVDVFCVVSLQEYCF